MKNGFESELKLHAGSIQNAKAALQAEIENEGANDETLKRLMDNVGESINKYAGNAATIKKRVVP